tara:strand:- start:193 stop:672 length:480 start_codon:yes stop_codon:yes gene_type:complete
MKNIILIFALGFIVLIMIFISTNYIKISSSNNSTAKSLSIKIDSLKKKYRLLDKRYSDEIYFSLNDNQEALAYFSNTEVDSIVSFIRDQLYEKNFDNNTDFFIPVSNANNKYLINKVKILNHKWIIADFSNGNRWGEMWIEYHFNENEINFIIKDYFLY